MNPVLNELPSPLTVNGSARQVGVEVEVGKLTAEEIAKGISQICGGAAREIGVHSWLVESTEFGDVEVYLDTRFRKDAESWLAKSGLDLAQLVVPVEIVTPPMPPSLLTRLDEVVCALARQGAVGTSAGILLGFGVHLNVEIADKTAAHIGGVATSFALLEDALRTSMQIDTSRRLLPFAAPYPLSLIDRLVAERCNKIDDVIALYVDENPTRNCSLDLMPILMDLAPELVADRVRDKGISARPTFHYRLPDCRLDEAGWSITREWNRWTIVEQAAHAEILSKLCSAWLEHRADGQGKGSVWAAKSVNILNAHGLAIPV